MRTTTKVRNTFIAVLASAGMLNAQLPCGSSEYNERMKQSNPAEIQQAEDQLLQERNFLFGNSGDERATTAYVIPVVFHIIHDYGAENISDAQVLNQVAILNRDFAKLNADTSIIVSPFQSIASSADIEFRLATLDPDGNCTNGIDRVASKRTYAADDGSKLNGWPRSKYLNVWVVSSIGAAGVAGYAYYPSSVTGMGMTVDGILILHDYIGSIGTGAPGRSRALTHEIGHWLDLAHTWGNTNDPGVYCGDDGIPDTPQTKGWTTCPSANASKVCDTAVVENYQNYMDYSYCSVMFTYYQKLAMHAALTSNVSDRNRLWTTSNLIATGTYVPATSTCVPVADFNGNRTMVCQGGTITYTDYSWNATVTARSWSFPGGTPSTSTATSPVVTYSTNGVYPVSLTVSNAAGADSISKVGYVYVGVPYAEVVAPVFEGFEGPQALSHGWIVLNNNNDAIYWHETNAGAATGTMSAVIDNYHNTASDVDALVSPLYDLRYLTGIQLTFKSAFASQVQDVTRITEKLKIFVSTNCGQTWSLISTKTGVSLLSAGLVPGYFVPTNDPQLWRTSTVNIATTYAQAQVRFKFEWTGGQYGNEFYLDDINITGNGVGVEETASGSSFDLFPNPSQDNTTIRFALTQRENVKITMTDLDGRVVKEISNGEFSEGEHVVPFSTAELASGMYLITVDNGTARHVKKLAVNH
ncbi:MAG: M43 family zinc metalloprotease [Bacteroidota bacterium]|nr:M43 family zinc metalloprotease [Bacteroidota bacterium]